jgi:hypothetical protein
MVYPALLPLMHTPRLPVVDRTDPPIDLNGLVHFAERRNLVSARVPSRFKHSLHHKTAIGTGSLPRVYWPRRGVAHPPQLAQGLEKDYSYTSNPSLWLHGMLKGKI